MPAKKRAPTRRSAKPAAPAKRKPASRAQRTSMICSLCGTMAQAPAGGIPPGWSFTTDDRAGLAYQCADCVRRNIRAIEGKLPQEWWE